MHEFLERPMIPVANRMIGKRQGSPDRQEKDSTTRARCNPMMGAGVF